VSEDHFRTDVSHLLDLEAYFTDLLRSRERLLVTVDADEWAKREAMPSDGEIRQVRHHGGAAQLGPLLETRALDHRKTRIAGERGIPSCAGAAEIGRAPAGLVEFRMSAGSAQSRR
jgi:hypothetical protein